MSNCPECGQEINNEATTCPNCGTTIAGKRPTRNRKGCWMALLGCMLLVLAVVCAAYFYYQHTQRQSEQRAYENAMQSNEPAILQNFLDIYADASPILRDSVKNQLGKLKRFDKEWDDIVCSKSKTDLLKYIQKHPGSVHVIEAKFLVDSIDWVQALTTHTLESYKSYLDHHQDGLHYDEARVSYEQIEQQQIQLAEKAKADSIARADTLKVATE